MLANLSFRGRELLSLLRFVTKIKEGCPIIDFGSQQNPQEKGPENNPKKSPREGSENHHQEQPGTTHPNLEKPRRIIYTCNKGSYKV
jgi:hypothetical protein